MKPQTITGKLERDKDSNWHYVHIPKPVRDHFEALEKRGIIAVNATIGDTSWQGSLLPWADGSAQISVSQAVRTREKLSAGDEITILLAPRPS